MCGGPVEVRDTLRTRMYVAAEFVAVGYLIRFPHPVSETADVAPMTAKRAA
jgi:hypothetical protein